MQWTNDARRTLRLKLATLYAGEREARALLEDAGLNVAYIDLSGSPVSRWYEALAEALLELATGGKPRKQQPATLPKSPFDPVRTLTATIAGVPVVAKSACRRCVPSALPSACTTCSTSATKATLRASSASTATG